MNNKLSVVIPTFNEIKTLPSVIEKVLAQKPAEIIIVDDCSTDDTWKFLSNLKNKSIKTFRHKENSGKGAAVRTGIQKATGTILIIQDADLEYDPSEYAKVLKPILDDRADVVYGSRFVGPEPHRIHYFWNFVGNRFLTTLTNLFANLNLSDMETGCKAFRKEVFDSINLTENDFGFEPEVTIKLAKQGYRFYEVGISYHGRSYKEGKKIRWTDGVKAVWVIVKHGLFS
ncbi:MAG: glycosyltransferase family 2 protein [Candidatus Harrisonbacteria bacterium]|nr:glycosyltransferase family 2 protein [Candidatus Harrisonbacteria bacterium]